MPRRKFPRRLPSLEILQSQVEHRAIGLEADLAGSWERIARALGREPSFLDTDPAGAGETLKAGLLHALATCETALVRRDRINPGNVLAWLARLRRLLEPLINGRQLRRRDLVKRSALLNGFFNLRDSLDPSTYSALDLAARRLADAIKNNEPLAQAAKQLDAKAAHQGELLKRWQAREPLPEGMRPRRVEGHREHIITLCVLLGRFWQVYATRELRNSKNSKAARRRFVTTVLDAGGIAHPDKNDYQTLDEWIETGLGSVASTISGHSPIPQDARSILASANSLSRPS